MGGGCMRMERLRGLEWGNVGGLTPASPQGLLSDRNMAASSVERLKLGPISEEDHCLGQEKSVQLKHNTKYSSVSESRRSLNYCDK